MDFLIRWLQKLTQANFIASPFPQCRSCLLYADDTLLFLKPTRTQLIKIGLLLRIFGDLSGLQVNMDKSEICVTSSQPFLTQASAAVLQCKPTAFPMNYLGLPLSHKKLTKTNYMPLIDKIQTKLMGWKASLLSIGGRMILVNSVLTAIPQFFMSMFLLPKWVLRAIDRIRRVFFWHGHKGSQDMHKGLYMVSWALATRPKELGGLGIRNIHLTNQALLAKWMWQWYDQNCSWWREATTTSDPSEKPWSNPHQTFFWKQIATIAPAFRCSIRHQVGNGASTQFWEDNWQGTPLKFLFPNLYQEEQQHHFSVGHHSTQLG